jgi:ATP-binding cassette subfamily B protein
MDCGPASLKCLLEGFGIRASYGRLREACQTSVDGTSIDVLEEIANRLGLEAEQGMVPVDHLLLPEADALPAILVVRNPDGATHFVVVWGRRGGLVQVMDPATGRRWRTARDLLAETFVHGMPVPAEAWRDWASDDSFLRPLRVRMRRIGALASGESLLERAAADASWRSLATLDASTRLVQALVDARAVKAGPEAARLVAATFERALTELAEPGQLVTCIPSVFWSAGPASPDDDGQAQVLLVGAVLVSVRGRKAAEDSHGSEPLPPELEAALREEPTTPLREFLGALRADGVLTPGLLAGATLVSALVAAIQVLVLRGLLGVSIHLGLWQQRLGAMIALVALAALALGVELPVLSETLRMGRRVELRLRTAFLAKIPRLPDRYFSSRPTSDMSHRAHAVHALRMLPQLGFRALRSAADLAIAACGLVWIDVRSWPYALAAVATCLVLPLIFQRALAARDLRVRAFDGALTRFYLDALLGLVPVRTHGAARSLRREHESMTGEFSRAFLGFVSVSTLVDALGALVAAAMAIGLLAQYLARGGDPASSLLLVYWALMIPAVGSELANVVQQYPELRNTTERLLEPLGALEDEETAVERGTAAGGARNDERGTEIRFSRVEVQAAGKTILEDIDLAIVPGAHVAIVGPSGAGKSSLCGLLLGWYRPARGEVLVDGEALRGEHLVELRRRTAWVDPAVALWNRPLLDNLHYGAAEHGADLSALLDAADLVRVLETLPDGMQTPLGDGGALLSGGEGQRVRLARAMLRSGCRLVVLDEPFRGLDRDTRRRLLERSRLLWKHATLICVTHDVGETKDFDRVLVIEGGRLIEDGAPGELVAKPGSRYAALLESDRAVREGTWRSRGWRRVELRAGVLVETGDGGLK